MPNAKLTSAPYNGSVVPDSGIEIARDHIPHERTIVIIKNNDPINWTNLYPDLRLVIRIIVIRNK